MSPPHPHWRTLRTTPVQKQNNNIAKGGMGGFSKHLGAQASSCGAMNAHAFQRQGRSRELQNGRRLGNFRYHSFRNDACMLSLSQGVPASSQGVYPFVLPIMCSFWRGFTGLWLLPGSIALTALCALGCSWLSPPLASLASPSGFLARLSALNPSEARPPPCLPR